MSILFFHYSLMRCWLCGIFKICSGNDRCAICFLCGTFDGSAGRSDHRSISIEEFRTEAARAATVVGSAWGICSLHNICHCLQSNKHGFRTTDGRKRGDETEAVSWFWYIESVRKQNHCIYN